MTRTEARAALLERLEQQGIDAPDGVAIIDSKTIEKPYGWVFFYNSRRFVETGELIHALVGHGPVIVVAQTREIIELGSATPSDEAIRWAEEHLQLA